MWLQNQVIQKVIQLEYQARQFTGFTISNDAVTRQYIVTVRHIFDKAIRNKSTVYVGYRSDNSWKQIACTVYLHESDGIDLAILALHDLHYIKPNYVVDLNSTGMIVSQDAYFLGYPFGLDGASEEINEGFPLPFIKRGVVSVLSSAYKAGYFFLDGYNNEGFSGGPVAFYRADKNTFSICGVVSGYLNERLAVKGPNSGIMMVCYIEKAIDILNANQLKA